MQKKYCWLVRGSFLLYLLYIYLTVYSQNQAYSFLLLNTFLGYIPIELAMHLKVKQHSAIFSGILILWLLFYPNAPYVLTDLFHLARFNPYDSRAGLMLFDLKLWLQFTNLVIAALGCSLLGMWSLDYVTTTCLKRRKLENFFFKPLLILIFNLIASIGIYIGRFERLHTAYLFIDPKWTLNEISTIWNEKMFIFVIFMTLIQTLIWLCLTLYRYSNSKA